MSDQYALAGVFNTLYELQRLCSCFFVEFIFGLAFLILNRIFDVQSWWIDMNFSNWSFYTIYTFLMIALRSLINRLIGDLNGWIIALIYNPGAGLMGGIKIKIDKFSRSGIFRTSSCDIPIY